MDGESAAKRPDRHSLSLDPKAISALTLECPESEDLLATVAHLVNRDPERLPQARELRPEAPEPVVSGVLVSQARERPRCPPFEVGVERPEHALNIAPIPRVNPFPNDLHVVLRHRRQYRVPQRRRRNTGPGPLLRALPFDLTGFSGLLLRPEARVPGRRAVARLLPRPIRPLSVGRPRGLPASPAS